MASTVKASIDWAKDGNFTGAFDNVTSRVVPGSRVVVEHGRDMATPLAPVTAGSGSLTLQNQDRRYSPRNTASPLFGQLKPARPVKLERTVGTTTYVLGSRMHTDSQPLNPDRDTETVEVRLVDYVADLRGKSLSTALFQSLRTGDAVGKILDGIGWTGPRALDPGVTVMPFWWEDGTDALDALDNVLRSEGWPALAYVDGAGAFVFRDRNHRIAAAASSTSQVTLRASGPEPVMGRPFAADEAWDGIVNDVTVSVPLRRVRDLQLVWESQDSVVVAGGTAVTLVVELDEACAEVFAPTQFVAGDFFAEKSQAQFDNPGVFTTTPAFTNVTATLSRTSGQSMILTLTNTGTAGEDETVTAISIYGRPVTATANVQVSASDATSITDYGSRGLPNSDLPWCNQYDAKRIIDSVVAQRKSPLTQVVATVKVGRTAAGTPALSNARAAAVLARAVSDRVTVIEPGSQINGDFHLERIRHDLADDLDHTVTFWLEAVPPTVAPALASMFTFDTNVAGRRFDSGAFG